MDNEFLFANDIVDEEKEPSVGSWKVIIIDDEPEVHAVTKLALSDFTFQDKSLEFLSAYSGTEGEKLITDNPDTAIVLLDVVMETDDAGLKVVRYIREKINNQNIRIILRTGQPGQAPERQVILDYDINDYKSKTELTAHKLFTVMMSSLRAYRDIITLDNSRQGLKKIIEASADIFSSHSMDQFIDGVMQQLISVIGCGTEEAMYISNSIMIHCSAYDDSLKVIAARGEFKESLGKPIDDFVDEKLKNAFNEAIENKSTVYKEGYLVAYCFSRFSNNSLLYVSGLPRNVGKEEKVLIELFSQNVQIAYENVQLQLELEGTQRELVYRLSEALESRSIETGHHAKRVALISEFLAKEYGMSNIEAELIKNAAPLHDVGKISIPDKILNKTEALDGEEWKVMQSHAKRGHSILKGSKRSIIKAGAIIARDHHENWDGSGYPEGRKGDDIHIYGRIVSLADVFDALRNKRCYKEAWSKEQALEFLYEQQGKKFDPQLVQILIEKIDEIENILAQYSD